jgi:large subunit ribosomal protein L15e
MPLNPQLKETFQKEFQGVQDENFDYKRLYQERLISYRKEKKSIVEVDNPTNLARARELGYKAKQGIVVVRVRVRKGSGLHKRPTGGRRPKRMGFKKLTRRISTQGIGEQRVAKKYPNMEVLNSYKVGEDGKNHYFEVILVDPHAPTIKKDKDLKWITEKQHKNRALRGLTSAQKKSRGLNKKGKNASKVRPSLRAKDRTAK